MKIEMLPADKLETLKNNISTLKPHFLEDLNKWITSYFNESPFIETRFVCDDFTITNSSNPKDDFENVVKLYSAMKIIPDSIATDERLWAGLSLGVFWNYSISRWSKEEWTTSAILDRMFFGEKNSNRRALTRNAISRLWWIGRLTYDENDKSDHFKYTKYVCSNQRFIVDVLERNISNNFELIKPCIDAIWKFEAENPSKKIDSNEMREIQKYINILGGTYILDCLDYEFLKNKIYNKITEIMQS